LAEFLLDSTWKLFWELSEIDLNSIYEVILGMNCGPAESWKKVVFSNSPHIQRYYKYRVYPDNLGEILAI
jgi:hypothetical protein